MKIDYAITRIKRKFAHSKLLVDNQDREAINEIIDFYNHTQTQLTKENKMFHKLFMHNFLNRIVIHDNSIDMAIKQTEDLLKLSINDYYKAFSDNSSYFKTCRLLEEVGYKNELPIDLTDGDIEENDKIIKENRERILKSILGSFSPDNAMKFVEQHVNELILKYRNHD